MTCWCWRSTPTLPTNRPTIWSMDWLPCRRNISITPSTTERRSRRETGSVVKVTSARVMFCMFDHSEPWTPMENGASSSKKSPGPDTLKLNASKVVCSPAPLAALWLLAITASVCKSTFINGCFPSIRAILKRESSSTFTSCHRLALVTFPNKFNDDLY